MLAHEIQPTDLRLQDAKRFLELLGNPEDARFRAFPHKTTPPERKQKLKARKFGYDGKLVWQAQQDGLGIYVVINRGGDTKASITECIAYFAEFDGIDEASQLQTIADSGLPEASIINRTQGGSLHFYWLLSEPVANKELWQGDMKRLAAHLGSDKSVNDPSRVMRLPGCFYMNGNQEPVGLVETIHIGEGRYTRDDIVSAIPADPAPLLERRSAPTKQTTDRTAERALDQLHRIPPRTPGSNTREDYLRLLWGLAHILGPAQAGVYMTNHSPLWAAEEDLGAKAKEANGSITDGTFFEVAQSVWGITDPLPHRASERSDEEESDDDRELRQEALKHFREAQQVTIDLVEVFGPFWGQLLIDRANAFPCDPVMLLLPMLGYASSLIGNRISVRIKTGWSEPLIVWGMIAQPASSLKSPAGGVFGKPLAKLQGQAARDHAKVFDTFKLKEKKWKADCKQLEKEASKNGTTPDLPEPPATPTPPRHYYFDSVTIERLAAVLAQPNVPGTICFHDELAKWFNALEKKAGQSDRPTWLNLWTGQALKHDTVTSLTAFAESTAVSIIGFIQPDKLAQLIANDEKAGAAGDGLWARFLPVIPRTVPFKYNDLEVDLTDDLIQLATQLDNIRPDSTLLVSSGALDNAFKPAWHQWSDLEMQSSPARASFLGKLRGYSVRLAGILHLINNGGVGDIDQPTAEVAVRLCKFFLAQFDQLMPQVVESNEVEDVDTATARFLQRVKDRDLKEVRIRDVQRWKLLGKGTTSKDCERFLRNLAAAGIGTFEQVHAKGSRRGAWAWKA